MQIPVTITQCNSAEQSDIIFLVQGDTNPGIIISLTSDEYNPVTGNTVSTPINVANSSVILKVRKVNSTNVFATVTGTKLEGILLTDYSISYVPPYDIPGVGGRVAFYWQEGDLSESGFCEAEVEITDETLKVQTVYDKLRIKIREQF